ncbi:hypothetical protein EXIGLDRAFT_298851 [Exidia glandulosa HHB12029]|uniref:Uncharacterized protein n=1 Tax=Exidia glandulosa HHB12029 TaxID=1314781 RepID=A0A165M067_EXIGL|nr:hypothetical protein EXIGLDRAFT_298851 [Exidia glandulosa HHB12029]
MGHSTALRTGAERRAQCSDAPVARDPVRNLCALVVQGPDLDVARLSQMERCLTCIPCPSVVHSSRHDATSAYGCTVGSNSCSWTSRRPHARLTNPAVTSMPERLPSTWFHPQPQALSGDLYVRSSLQVCRRASHCRAGTAYFLPDEPSLYQSERNVPCLAKNILWTCAASGAC